jgi:hypothetical protein
MSCSMYWYSMFCPMTEGVAKNVQLLESQTQCPWELHRVLYNTSSTIVSSFCLVHGFHEDNMECGDETPHILIFGTRWRSVVNLMLSHLRPIDRFSDTLCRKYDGPCSWSVCGGKEETLICQ